MVKDVAPELFKQITTTFSGHVLTDRQVRTITRRIKAGRADLTDCHKYAERLGEDLSKALTETLTPDNLPNGTLYYNIAQRTVVPALEQNYDLVNEAATAIQKQLDDAAKIGLGSVHADFPHERVQGLIDKMTADDITPEQVTRWLREPIINNSEAFVDDFVEANAKFRHNTGLKTQLIRKADPKCCEWCAALEGAYDYGEAPEDIYCRHEYCRCTVTFKSNKTRQDVWSKRTWQEPQENLDKRKDYGTGRTEPKTPQEVMNQSNRLYRDAIKSELRKENAEVWEKYANATGEEKVKALDQIRELKKLTPEERIELFEKSQARKKGGKR